MESEACEVLSVDLRTYNQKPVIAFSLRIGDSVEDLFLTIENAYRLRLDIDHFLQKLHFRPPMEFDHE